MTGRQVVVNFKNWNSKKFSDKIIIKQGGISDSIWNNPRVQESVSMGVAGYLGDPGRTIRIDKIIMKFRKQNFYSDEELIDKFLLHKNGRIFFDVISNYKNISESEIFNILRDFLEVKQ